MKLAHRFFVYPCHELKWTSLTVAHTCHLQISVPLEKEHPEVKVVIEVSTVWDPRSSRHPKSLVCRPVSSTFLTI